MNCPVLGVRIVAKRYVSARMNGNMTVRDMRDEIFSRFSNKRGCPLGNQATRPNKDMGRGAVPG